MAIHTAVADLTASATLDAHINRAELGVTATLGAAPTLDSVAFTNWRLYVITNNGDTYYTALSKLRFLDPEGAFIPNPTTATASSSYSARPVSNLLDDTETTEWSTDNQQQAPCWVEFEYDEAVKVGGVWFGLYGLSGTDSYPLTFKIEHYDVVNGWVDRGGTFTANYTGYSASTYATAAFFIQPGGTLFAELPTFTLSATAEETPPAEFDLTLPALSAEGAGTEVGTPLPALTLDATGYSGTIGELEESLTLGLESDGTCLNGGADTLALTLPSLEVAAEGPTTADLTLPALACAATAYQGGAGTSAKELPALSLEGTALVELVGAATLELGTLTLVALGEGQLTGSASIALKKLALAAEGYSGRVGEAAIDLPLVEVDGTGAGQVIGTASVTLPALYLQSTEQAGASSYSGGFALNTMTNGLTSYSSYGFNSFADFGGVVLGANSAGVYALTGADDAGAAIAALARSGVSDFGSDRLKRVRGAYVGYRTDGDLRFTVTTDEGEPYEYRLTHTGKTGIHAHREKFGRGVKGRYWQYEISNTAGDDFDLDNVELLPDALKRKV